MLRPRPPSPADLKKEATARKDLRDTLRTLKKGQRVGHAQRGVCQRSCLSWRWIHCTLQFRDSVPHGLGFDKRECAKLTAAKDTMFKGVRTEEMEPRHIWHICLEE